MNLFRGHPIVFTLRLVQQHYAVIILQLKSVFVPWIRQSKPVRPNPLGREIAILLEDLLRPVQDAQ
jgi:hypothetical protein